MQPIPEIEEGMTARIEDLGLEVVQIEWKGTSRRPVIRVRVDFPDSMPGSGVTVQDCARVSRVIEGWLDELPAVPERYVLEVSSPGVERPLARRRDFVRFAGREVRLRAAGGAFGTADRDGQVRGTLEGVEGDGEEYSVVLRTTDGDRLHLPRGQIGAANLVFHWNEDG